MKKFSNSCEFEKIAPDRVDVWPIYIPDVQPQITFFETLLSQKEREKAEKFLREKERVSSILARGILRILLSKYSDENPQDIIFHYSDAGKPFIDASIDFNLSHSGEWILLAFGTQRAVGIDIEKVNFKRNVLAVAERYFSSKEVECIKQSENPIKQFFNFWAQKEAYIKACGSTLFQELSDCVVPLPTKNVPNLGTKGDWFFQTLEISPEYAAAVVTNRSFEQIKFYDFGAVKWEN